MTGFDGIVSIYVVNSGGKRLNGNDSEWHSKVNINL